MNLAISNSIDEDAAPGRESYLEDRCKLVRSEFQQAIGKNTKLLLLLLLLLLIIIIIIILIMIIMIILMI